MEAKLIDTEYVKKNYQLQQVKICSQVFASYSAH